MIPEDFLIFFLLAFLGFAGVLLCRSISSILHSGLGCSSAFSLMWVFAYAGPTLLFLIAPEVIASRQSYAWIDLERWSLTALVALIGFVFFQSGYRFGKIHHFHYTRTYHDNVGGRKDTIRLLLLYGSLALQLFPILIVVFKGININFLHRSVHWQKIGPTIRLAFFSLPSFAIAYSLILSKKTFFRTLLLIIALLISGYSILLLGTRIFVVLVFFIVFLIYTNQNPKSRLLLFTLLFVIAIFVPVGYTMLLRSEGTMNPAEVFFSVLSEDVGRVHTLSYAIEHASWMNSDLVHPPILGSYFYWMILPIPRAVWEAKPYATNLQFSFYFRRDHTSFFVPAHISEMSGSTEFGFIEEALLNLGVMGFFIVFLFGCLAAKLDKWAHNKQYLGVVFPAFFLLGTIYTFNGISNYFVPFLLTSYILEKDFKIRLFR